MVTVNLSKWYHGLIAMLPLLALIGSFWLWLDTRYMHREIAQQQYTVLRYELALEKVKTFERLREDGHELDASERVEYNQAKTKLEFAQNEYNKMLGGGLPE